jgi:hypothetical protein
MVVPHAARPAASTIAAAGRMALVIFILVPLHKRSVGLGHQH